MKRSNLIGTLFAGVVTLYALILLILLALSLGLSEDVPVVGMVKSVLQLALLPSLALFPLSLLSRRWRLTILMTPVILALILMYGVYFVPRSVAAAANGETILTLLSFNIEAPPDDEMDSLVEIIRSSGADMVGIQELSLPAAGRFNLALDDLYPYRALRPQEDRHQGQGFLSKYPIVADDYWRLETAPSLGHQRVEVTVDGRRVVVFNTHPIPPYSIGRGVQAVSHSREIDDLIQRANDETAPVILLGDFNMTDQFDDYERLTAQYVDTYREAGAIGFGFTYPTTSPIGNEWRMPPLLRIDYIFHDESFRGLSARVGQTSGSSDHLPLYAELALVEASRGG